MGVAAGVGEFVREWEDDGVVARLARVAEAVVPAVVVLFFRPQVGLLKARLATNSSNTRKGKYRPNGILGCYLFS